MAAATATATTSAAAEGKSNRQKKSAKANGMWQCTTCTFANKQIREQCEMCEMVRHKDRTSCFGIHCIVTHPALPAHLLSPVQPNPRAVDPPASSVVAAGSSKPAAAAAAQSNGKPPKLPTPSPAPAPAPITLVSNVSATFKANAYENGLITACNNLTYDEVMRRRLVGLPRANYDLVMRLKHKASAIFLINLESKELFGVFEADGQPGLDLEPDAWSGSASSSYKGSNRSSRFPAQCRFTLAADFETPIPERHYREIFARDPQKKIRTLTGEEVKKLIKIFQTRSKLRKVPAAAPAPTPAAAPAAQPNTMPAAAPQNAANASATNSRRNSVDSTASDDTKKPKRVTKSVPPTHTALRPHRASR